MFPMKKGQNNTSEDNCEYQNLIGEYISWTNFTLKRFI